MVVRLVVLALLVMGALWGLFSRNIMPVPAEYSPASVKLGPAMQRNYVLAASAIDVDDRKLLVGADNGASGVRVFLFDRDHKKVITSYPIKAKGSRVIEVDGGVAYIGTFIPAEVYRYEVATDKIERLASFPDATYVWDLDFQDGVLYAGTGGERAGLYRVDLNRNAVEEFPAISVSTQNMVRSLTLHNNKLYAGTGTSGAELFEIDLKTGGGRNVLPVEYQKASTVNWLGVVNGKVAFAVGNKVLTYNGDDTFTTLMEDAIGQPPQDVSYPDNVFRGYGDLFYELLEGTVHRVGPPSFHPLGGGIVDGGLIAGITRHGNYVEYDLEGNSTFGVKLSAVGLPRSTARPYSMAVDNGKVFAAERDLRVFDLNGEQDGNFPLLGESKAICLDGRSLFSAHYTGAVLWKFDTVAVSGDRVNLFDPSQRIWELGHGQNRPTSIVCTHDYVAIGTEPDYGTYGGALSIYSEPNKKVVLRNIVPDQTIFSLAASGDDVFAGSAATGGSGTKRLDVPARIVRYDASSGKVMFNVPVESWVVRSIAVGADIVLAVLDNGEIISLDRATGETVAADAGAGASQVLTNIDGKFLVSTTSGIFYLSPKTLQKSSIAKAHRPYHFTEDRETGDLFWIEADMLVALKRQK